MNSPKKDLKTSYTDHIQMFSAQLVDQTEEDILSTELTPQQIRTTIHNQKIRSLINNCRQSLELMATNKKLLKTNWIKRLDEENRQLFEQLDNNSNFQHQDDLNQKFDVKTKEQRLTDETIRKINKILD